MVLSLELPWLKLKKPKIGSTSESRMKQRRKPWFQEIKYTKNWEIQPPIQMLKT
jgi:hypothetical protein